MINLEHLQMQIECLNNNDYDTYFILNTRIDEASNILTVSLKIDDYSFIICVDENGNNPNFSLKKDQTVYFDRSDIYIESEKVQPIVDAVCKKYNLDHIDLKKFETKKKYYPTNLFKPIYIDSNIDIEQCKKCSKVKDPDNSCESCINEKSNKIILKRVIPKHSIELKVFEDIITKNVPINDILNVETNLYFIYRGDLTFDLIKYISGKEYTITSEQISEDYDEDIGTYFRYSGIEEEYPIFSQILFIIRDYICWGTIPDITIKK